jgi:error-prone DNA polymerase
MGAMRVAPGARLVFSDGAPDILAYPKDRAAYGRLARLLTSGNLRAKKGECRLTINDLLDHAEGLSIAVMPRAESPRETEEAEAFLLSRLSEAFPRRAWLAASLTYGAHMRGALAERAALSRASGLPLLATNDVLMHAPERRALADVVACIREGVRIEEAGRLLAANAERHLKDPAEMARLFREAPQALEETIRFFDGLSFSLDELSPSYPEELREGYRDPQAALEAFTWAGALKRYPSGVPEKVVRARADRAMRICALLSDRARHHPLCAIAGKRDSCPRARLGGQFFGLLLPWRHRDRSGAIRIAFRPLHLARTQRAARHRRRFRA